MTEDRAGVLAVRAAGVVVVASIALALAALTWRIVGWDDGRSSVYVAETSPPLVAGANPDVARIIALAPFGGAPVGDGLPMSSQGLVLKGIVQASPPEASTALISLGDAAAGVFGVGQSPAANAVIESIERERVILRIGDRREQLTFPAPVAGVAPPPTSAPGITIGQAGAQQAPASAPTSEASAALAAASPIATAAAAKAAASAPAAPAPARTPAAALTSMGVTATSTGYRIGANPSPELQRVGLRAGDVIETLNGRPIGDVANDQQLIQRAVASGGARVEVVRDGRRLTLSFPLR